MIERWCELGSYGAHNSPAVVRVWLVGTFAACVKTIVSLISVDNELVTLINVFTVEPRNQDNLIKILERVTEEVMRHIPGFISDTFVSTCT
jgi:hypothetical protein